MSNFNTLRCLAFGLVLFASVQPSFAEEKKVCEFKYFDIPVGRIAFTLIKGNSRDIYVADFKELAVFPVITNNVADEAPAFSPDGKKIAFHSDLNGDRDIYIANADGTDTQQITTTTGEDEFPSWNPEGNKLVFQGSRNGKDTHIYIVGTDGTNLQALTSGEKKQYSPRWSRRGDEILFATNTEWPGWDIVIYNFQTKAERVISKGFGSYTRPFFHPDGSGFLFSYGAGEDIDIWQAFKGNATPIAIVAKEGRQLDGIFDDTARFIFFVSEEAPGDGKFQLFVYDSLKPVTNKLGETIDRISQVMLCDGAVRHPSWTPFPSIESLMKEEKRKKKVGNGK